MMYFLRLLVMAMQALRRNIMRSSLTALGIIIGVGSVIAMMEIGEGSAQNIQEQIASMGANNLVVLPGAATSGGASFGSGSSTTLTPEDAEAIKKECPAVVGIAPMVRSRTQVIFGGMNWVPQYIYGTTPEYLTVRDWTLSEGEMFSDRDVQSGAKVCVVGETIVRELCHGISPVGQEVRVNNVPLRVIGVLTRKGANVMGTDQDDTVIAPWTTIKFRVSGVSATTANQSSNSTLSTGVNATSQAGGVNRQFASDGSQPADPSQGYTAPPVRFINVDQIIVQAGSPDEVADAIRQVTSVLHDRHRIGPGALDDFNIRDMVELARSRADAADTMANLLLAVSMISLVVGGVGIMNIMLVSVTERTREIGLRMAVGARAKDILRQFLGEAVMLCIMGGVVGILAGRGGAYLIHYFKDWRVESSWPIVFASVGVAAGVGIVFGYYPAWKAAHLDPIEALRYE